MFRSRSRTILRIAAAVALAPLAPAATAAAELAAVRPHVLILGFANDTVSPALAAACATASGVLDLTMRQLPGYEVLPPIAKAGPLDIGTLRDLATQREADFILFGKMSSDDSGRFACELSLFDRAKGAIAVSRRSDGLGALELFDSTDELVAEVLGEMTGRHIGFGRIEFRNAGEKASYRVLLDDLSVGSDLASLGNVLVGKHRIRVLQDRILGEYVLADKIAAIGEGESLECGFSAPAITDAERDKLEGLEAEVRSSWRKPGLADAIEGAVLEYGRLALGAKYGAAFDEYRRRSSQLAGEWKVVRNRAEIESLAWSPNSGIFDPSMAAYLESGKYPDPEAIRSLAQENALLLASLIELAAGKDLGAGNMQAALQRLESIMDFSRCLPTEYRTAYTYAASKLAEIARTQGDDPTGGSLVAAFGPSIEAAKSFYGAKPGADEWIVLPSRRGMRLYEAAAPAPREEYLIPASMKVATLRYEGEGLCGDIDLMMDDRRFAIIDFGPTGFGLATVPARHPPKAGAGEIVVRSGAEPDGEIRISIRDAESGDERARGTNSLSALLPPGKYEVIVSLAGEEGAAFREMVELASAGERRIEVPLSVLSSARERKELEANREELLAKRGNAKRYGAYSLTGLGIGIASFFLGEYAGPAMGDAYIAYQGATNADDAEKYRSQTELNRALVYTAIIVCVPALVAAPVFFVKWDMARKVDKQIAAIDEQIKRFSGKGLAE